MINVQIVSTLMSMVARINQYTNKLTKNKYVNFKKSCDCFCSLHFKPFGFEKA